MEKEELLVIAAAAVAFVIINIIMWTFIAVKEKRAKRKSEAIVSQSIPQSVRTPHTVSEQIQKSTSERGSVSDSVRFSAAEPPLNNSSSANSSPAFTERKKRSDFVIVDNIVMIHTDEIM